MFKIISVVMLLIMATCIFTFALADTAKQADEMSAKAWENYLKEKDEKKQEE